MKRRKFIVRSVIITFGYTLNPVLTLNLNEQKMEVLKLFLAGDVMTGRGIDQLFATHVDPILHEPYIQDAREYIEIAKQKGSKIPDKISYKYVWGEALDILKKENPDLRMVNLETSITTNSEWEKQKRIHYRMHPANIEILKSAGLQLVHLANNHILDWGISGGEETIKVLKDHQIIPIGAGKDIASAGLPFSFSKNNIQVKIFAAGHFSSGIPPNWRAKSNRFGIYWLEDLSDPTSVINHINKYTGNNEIVIFSVHWGPNWGYDIDIALQDFAHQLIDSGTVDLIFGHSSHHPIGMEVHKNKLIIYGSGDLINDYEGIAGHKRYRGDLSFLFFPILNTSGDLLQMRLFPMYRQNFTLQKCNQSDKTWLLKTFNEKMQNLGTRLVDLEDHLELEW